MKPGYLTTEFWITTVAQLLGVLVLIGYVRPEDRDTIQTALAKTVEAVGVLLTMAGAVKHYIHGRAIVKAAFAAQPPTLTT